MTEQTIDLPDLKAKAQAAVELGCHDDFHGIRSAYRKVSNATTILILIDALEELETYRRALLEDAVVCGDAGGFVRDLINEAKTEGITMDGKTLVAAD